MKSINPAQQYFCSYFLPVSEFKYSDFRIRCSSTLFCLIEISGLLHFE